MIRKLLTTTALIAVMTGGTYAAQHDQMTKSDGVGVMVFTTDSMPSETSSTGYHEAQSGQILASTLIGQTVYNVHAGDAETDSPESIGEVDDVVMGPNGGAQAVIISVGGFLGIGEKDVAVDYQRLQWINRDGENWLAIEATSEELEAAPAFEHAALENGMDGRATMGGDTATMDGDTARVDSDTAMKTNAGEAAIDSDSAMPTSRRDALKVVDRGSLSAENLLGTTSVKSVTSSCRRTATSRPTSSMSAGSWDSAKSR